jgi:hypothetical protein
MIEGRTRLLKLLPSFTITWLLLAVACSNQVKMASSTQDVSTTFKSLQDSLAKGTFNLKEGPSQEVASQLGGELKLFGHLDKDRVVFANDKGNAAILNLSNDTVTSATASAPAGVKPDWIYAFGQNEYWAVGNGKLYFSSKSDTDEAVIEDSLQNVFDSPDIKLRPIHASDTDLIAVSGDKLVWLATVPNLRRELFLRLDSSSLGNSSPDTIVSAGVIKGRGLWLQAADSLVYILKDREGRYSPERTRLPQIKASSGKLSAERISGLLTAEQDARVVPLNGLVALQANKIYVAGGASSGGGSDKPGTTGPVAQNPSPTPTATATPTGPSLADLQGQYNNRFKALIDARCVACHSNRTSRWNTFDNVKLYADQGSSRVDTGDMPRGGTLSATDKRELTDFLKALARLP